MPVKPPEHEYQKEILEGILNNLYDSRSLKHPLIDNTFSMQYNKRRRKPIAGEEASHMENDKILEKYMDMINQDRRDMEKRLIDDRRESESRIDETVKRIENKIDKQNDKIEANNRYMHNISIAVIIGIAAMVLTVVGTFITVILTK